MSGTYKSTGGESFNTVARRATGTDLNAAAIRKANPGVPEPIPAGITLQIPTLSPIQPVETEATELEIVVSGKTIKTFDNFEIVFSIDAITKAGFTVPNEPETRELFLPFSQPEITIIADGTQLMSGRCENPKPNTTTGLKTLDISCYSAPGILEITTPPISAFPLEFKDAPLSQIADDLCGPHNIPVTFEEPSTLRFKRVDIKPGQKILDFLAGLARQRGLVIADTPDGSLLFRKGTSIGDHVASLVKGLHPCENVDPSINEEQYYSSVTGTIPAKSRKDKAGKKFTVQNPYLTDLVRSYNFEATDLDEGELETATNFTAGQMFAGVYTADVDLSTWHNDLMEIYQPNTTMFLESEDDFIPTPYEFLISQVSLRKTFDMKSATLRLVLPGTFSGEMPESLPWQ